MKKPPKNLKDISEEEKEGETGASDLIDKVRLFNRWSFKGIKIDDISLEHYLNLRPIIVPHTGGKHQHKKFWKTEDVSVIERFLNKIMSPGLISKRIKGRGASHNMGKKQKLLKILYNAFSIIETEDQRKPNPNLSSGDRKRGTTGRNYPNFHGRNFLPTSRRYLSPNVESIWRLKLLFKVLWV